MSGGAASSPVPGRASAVRLGRPRRSGRLQVTIEESLVTAGWRAGAATRCAGTGRPRLPVSGLLADGRQKESPLATTAAWRCNTSHPVASRYDGHAARVMFAQRPHASKNPATTPDTTATPATTPLVSPAATPRPTPSNDPGRDPGCKHKEERHSPITRKHGLGTRSSARIASHDAERPNPSLEPDRDPGHNPAREPDHDPEHEPQPRRPATTPDCDPGRDPGQANSYSHTTRGSFDITPAWDLEHDPGRDADPAPDRDPRPRPLPRPPPASPAMTPATNPTRDPSHAPAEACGTARCSCHQARSGLPIVRSRWRARNTSHFSASCAFQRPAGSCR